MQAQSTDWLEVLKAIGPYVTAIIAIIASSITAWLTHRNWLKQFLIEKSFVLRQEQIRLLQEIPKKLTDTQHLAVQMKIWPMLRDLLFQFLQENESLPNEMRSGIEAIDDRLVQAQNNTAEQFSQMSTEFETLRIILGLYFGRETEEALVAFIKEVAQALQPNPKYDEIRNNLNDLVKNAAKGAESQSQLFAEFVGKAQQGMEPLFEEVQQSKVQVIRSMVSYLRKAA